MIAQISEETNGLKEWQWHFSIILILNTCYLIPTHNLQLILQLK
jgi:hypothetical protein